MRDAGLGKPGRDPFTDGIVTELIERLPAGTLVVTDFMPVSDGRPGLEPEQHRILEAAVIVTDWNFKPLKRFSKAVFQPDEELKKMDEWCVKTHGASGLLKRVPEGLKENEVDLALVDIVKEFFLCTLIIFERTF